MLYQKLSIVFGLITLFYLQFVLDLKNAKNSVRMRIFRTVLFIFTQKPPELLLETLLLE
jgi:hypothetical protein